MPVVMERWCRPPCRRKVPLWQLLTFTGLPHSGQRGVSWKRKSNIKLGPMEKLMSLPDGEGKIQTGRWRVDNGRTGFLHEILIAWLSGIVELAQVHDLGLVGAGGLITGEDRKYAVTGRLVRNQGPSYGNGEEYRGLFPGGAGPGRGNSFSVG